MSLKRIIKPEDMENHFAEIKMPKPIGVQVLDASKPIDFYVEQVRGLRRRFGHEQFIGVSAQMDNEETVREQQQETARLTQLKKAETLHKLEDTPLTRFIRAVKLKNTSYAQLNEWTTKHTNTEKKATLAEFETLAQRRGLALSIEQIDFATNFLRSTITTEPQPQQPNILTRLKNAFEA